MTFKPERTFPSLQRADDDVQNDRQRHGKQQRCDEWRQYGRDLRNTRNQVHEHSIGSTNVKLLKKKWVFSNARAGAEGEIESTPIVANGCLYVGTITGRSDSFFGGLTEVDKHAQRLSRAHLRQHQRRHADRHPTMMAFSQATGRVLWSTTMTDAFGAGFFGSPGSLVG
jgi:outer membrane protein assembly factor BamB